MLVMNMNESLYLEECNKKNKTKTSADYDAKGCYNKIKKDKITVMIILKSNVLKTCQRK